MTSSGRREHQPDGLTAREYLESIHPVAAEERIAYATGPTQWFDVYWPSGRGPFPIVVLIHGGCWSTVASAESVSPNAAELADSGVAVCNLEYRRVGEPGGGFPGTYLDLAKATDSLRSASISPRLDLARLSQLRRPEADGQQSTPKWKFQPLQNPLNHQPGRRTGSR